VKLEYIEWLDSSGYDGWHEPSHKELSKHLKIKSIGWITGEDDVAITLTNHIHTKTKNHHADMTIPKCAIVKREVKG